MELYFNYIKTLTLTKFDGLDWSHRALKLIIFIIIFWNWSIEGFLKSNLQMIIRLKMFSNSFIFIIAGLTHIITNLKRATLKW